MNAIRRVWWCPAILAGLLVAQPALGLVREDPDSGVTPQIVNGVETQVEATTGALLADFGDGFYAQGCSGVLVGCRSFLTAAHCVCGTASLADCPTPDPSQYRVFLQHVGVLAVADIDVHPDYLFEVGGDVALLTLESAVEGIVPARINTLATPVQGTPGTIVGFGTSSGGARDAGIKRRGAVEISTCAASSDPVTEPAHVCWEFKDPLGDPGTNSNTCMGDSGGPLFVEVAGVAVVAGVTSGGDAFDCLPDDVSFDANIFENHEFLEAAAGDDLGRIRCGAESHIGEAQTSMVSVRMPVSSDVQACRKLFNRTLIRYARTTRKIMGRCFDDVADGSVVGGCPNEVATRKLGKARTKVKPKRFNASCDAFTISEMGLRGACADAADGEDLAACVLETGDVYVAASLDDSYADEDPNAPLPDAEMIKCQADIGKTSRKYWQRSMKLWTACRHQQDKGKAEACLTSRRARTLDRQRERVQANVEASCSDDSVRRLNDASRFGGPCEVSWVTADMSECLIAGHDALVDEFLGMSQELNAAALKFTVPEGSTRLSVTVNGVDAGINDIDLYVNPGQPPTPDEYAAASQDLGVFEGVTVESPVSGTWYATVDRVDGDASIPYQLTISAFQP